MELETTVFGYSQSAIISGLLQSGYTVGTGATAVTYTVPDNIKSTVDFVLVGNELNSTAVSCPDSPPHRLRAGTGSSFALSVDLENPALRVRERSA